MLLVNYEKTTNIKKKCNLLKVGNNKITHSMNIKYDAYLYIQVNFKKHVQKSQHQGLYPLLKSNNVINLKKTNY